MHIKMGICAPNLILHTFKKKKEKHSDVAGLGNKI